MTSDQKRTLITGLFGAWLALVVLASAFGVRAEERVLTAAAAEAVSAVGSESIVVDFEGRDAIVAGPAAARSATIDSLSSIVGVRAVSWTDVEVIEALVPPPQATTTTTTVPAPAVAAEPQAHLEAVLERGHLHVTGELPSARVLVSLRATTELIYAPLLVDQVAFADVATASWVPSATRVVAMLPMLGSASVSLEGETAVVAGSAPTAARKNQFLGALSAVLGRDVVIEDDIVVTGRAAPRISASADADGMVRIAGVVPDEEIADAIVAAVEEAYGPENVDADVVIVPRVDASFSLFRLPLVLPQFADVPQWSLVIEDDVIVGALRGGATFASGSAELTPELISLLDTASGILLRNPGLAMLIEGHTDAVGGASTNQELSEQRAGNAAEYLVHAGVPAERVRAIGHGEDLPIADNSTDVGRMMNRRIEFGFGPPPTEGGM